MGEFSVRPNRPKTIARNPTIPQKVTNVSIHDKGPELRPVGAKARLGRRGEAPTGRWTTESNTLPFKRC